MRRPRHVFLSIVREHEAEVRKLADAAGFDYTVHPDRWLPEAVLFRFVPMSDAAFLVFFDQVPEDAHAMRAYVLSGGETEH